MSSPRIERKLAAIMFTDIAGYTEQMSKNEDKALALLDKQEQILTPIIEEFNGTLHNRVGDGLLFTFPTVTDAVRCGIKIQEETKAIDDLNLRIGIHEGEITIKDGDALGDDVNVASRIDPFAAEGGIVITGKVQQNISSLPEFETTYVGTPKLKGVAQKVEVYCITSHGLPKTDVSKVSAKLEDKSNFNIYTITGGILTAIGIAFWIAVGVFDVSFGGKEEVPSVGILMMENRGAEEDEFWASGITQDLIVKVAGAGLIRVAPMKEILEVDIKESFREIAKKLRVKYILTSSIYKKEDGFDLHCQLIEAESGNSKYANKWSESIDKAPTIVGNLAQNILKSLRVSTKQEMAKAPTANTEAYKYYLESKYIFDKRENMKDIEVARGLLHKAIELDDNLILAKELLGWSYEAELDLENAFKIYNENVNQAEKLGDKRGMARSLLKLGSIYDLQRNIEKSLDCATRSLDIFEELGDKLGIASTQNALAWYFMDKNDFVSALDYFTRSLEVQEEMDDKWQKRFTLRGLGVFYSLKGDYEKSLHYLTRSLELREELGDKWGMGNVLSEIGGIYASKGDYDKALNFFDRSLKIRKNLGDKIRIAGNKIAIGAVYYYKGDYEKAVEYFEQSISIQKESVLGEDERYLGSSLETTTHLFISYEYLDRKYDVEKIHTLIKEAENIEYGLNFSLYQLLEDTSYLETAYNQIQEKADAMENELKLKFLSHPIPKAIVEEWEKVK